MTALKYKRVLLKISGEALMGDQGYGVSPDFADKVAREVKAVVDLGVEVAMVVGGGNIFRGVSGAAAGMDRAAADYMGMLATVINALALKSSLEKVSLNCRVQSAIPMHTVCEPYIRDRALRHLEKGRVVLFAAGTGNPFFTTDTGAVLRASEMHCDALLKGTKVDGIYTADPHKDKTATHIPTLTYQEVLEKDLRVMDQAAFALAKEEKLPLIIFSLLEEGNMSAVLQGQGRFSIVN